MTQQKKRARLPLATEIAIVLACKLCALLALWHFCFGPETRPAQTPDAVAQAFFSSSAPSRPSSPSGESR